MESFSSGMCWEISLRKERMVYVTPPEQSISGSKRTMIESMIGVEDEDADDAVGEFCDEVFGVE